MIWETLTNRFAVSKLCILFQSKSMQKAMNQ